MNKAIKVVKPLEDGRLVSTFFRIPPLYKIEYRIGEWAHPIIGKLFVFKDLEAAGRDFGMFSPDYHFYECEVLGLEQLDKRFTTDLSIDTIIDYWTRGILPPDDFSNWDADPKCYYLTSGVKLLTRLC